MIFDSHPLKFSFSLSRKIFSRISSSQISEGWESRGYRSTKTLKSICLRKQLNKIFRQHDSFLNSSKAPSVYFFQISKLIRRWQLFQEKVFALFIHFNIYPLVNLNEKYTILSSHQNFSKIKFTPKHNLKSKTKHFSLHSISLSFPLHFPFFTQGSHFDSSLSFNSFFFDNFSSTPKHPNQKMKYILIIKTNKNSLPQIFNSTWNL